MRGGGVFGVDYAKTMLKGHLGPRDYEPVNDMLPPIKGIKKPCDPALESIWDRMLLCLLQLGVSERGGRVCVMSAAHTKEDSDYTTKALGESLDGLGAEGSLPGRMGAWA